MATLLDNSSLPLWIWIVIIVVCSLVFLGTIAFSIRFCVNRRRQASFIDTFGDENLPQRRVTVRRGRVVEQSRYLSLTGSRFGLNAFGTDGNDGSTRDGARSKSPFEWWTSGKDRSQSRSSQITQATIETSSVYGAPPSPGLPRMYQRQDLNVSTSSFGSTMKDDASVAISVIEEEPTSPPQLVRNFSRSFSRQGHNSPYSPRIQTLSRIEEASPHNSMISERASRVASYANNNETKAGTPSLLPGSPSSSTQFLRRSLEQNNSSRMSPLQHETINHTTIQAPPMAYNGARCRLSDVVTALPQRTEGDNAGEPPRSRQQPLLVTRSPEMSATSTTTQQASAAEHHPRRSGSKTAKVLRKKSLTRSQLVSRIDS